MSKIISGKDASGARSWAPPNMDRAAPAAAQGGTMLTAAQIEQLQRQAYDEAYTAGLEEGRAAGRNELLAKGGEVERLLGVLARPFEDLDEQVEQELVTLAMALVRQLVRREIRSDPGQIVAVVRDAMALLPVASRNVRLHLHPEDASLVREALTTAGEERPWSIVEDPMLARGGCKVITDYSQVDASLESRLAQLFTQVFGGERGSDRRTDEPAP